MSDFYQTGIITTLHQLGKPSLERLESELLAYSKTRPLALVLPALYSEFEGPAMPGIVQELAKVKYLNEIVLVLDKGSQEDFQRVREFMSPISTEVKIIHNDGKRISEIYETFARNGFNVGERGKGRSVWLAYGYVLARGRSDVIALHDCDIVTYSRELLARLCYPVVNPIMLPRRQPQPGLRVLQRVLQPGIRQNERACHPAAGDAAGQISPATRRAA